MQDNEASKSIINAATIIKELANKFSYHDVQVNRSKSQADSSKHMQSGKYNCKESTDAKHERCC